MDHTLATHLNILMRLRIKTHKLMNLLLARTIVKITPPKNILLLLVPNSVLATSFFNFYIVHKGIF